jgi:hypothetical protein
MSSKGRGKPAEVLDRYYTPRPLVRTAFDFLAEHHGTWLSTVRTVLEPGSGPGTFIEGAQTYCRSASFTGVDPAPPPRQYAQYHRIQKDYLSWRNPTPVDLCCTNPPFSLAASFMRKAVSELSPHGRCLFLMRMGILASVERSTMWRDEIQLEEVWVCSRRPSFRGGPTDSAEYGFFLFKAISTTTPPIVRWLPL